MRRGTATIVTALIAVAVVVGLVVGFMMPALVTLPTSTPTTDATTVSPSSQPPNTTAPTTAPTGRPTSEVALDAGRHKLITGYDSPDRAVGPFPDVEPEGFAEAPGGGLAGYLKQKIEWESCGTTQECASILAPLDYRHPDEQAITITLLRVKSARGGKGPLFVNPGGPGGSGREMASGFTPDTYPGYDIVGWDPRGSGTSTPIKCGSDAQTDAFFNLDGSPDDEAEFQAIVEGSRAFASQCRASSGRLLDHVSTIENVRDLDMIRQLMGAEKLNFLGVSYGTYVGAMYAELFPQHTGRLVLDSAVNITENDSVIQATGFDLSLRNYAAWAAKQGHFATTQDGVIDKIVGFVDGLDATPLKVGDRQLTQTLAATGIAFFLYADEEAYSTLTQALEQAMEGQGAWLLVAADGLNSRGRDGHWDTMAFAFPATSCIDSADKGVAEARKQWATNQKLAPIFGRWMGISVTCEVWTAAPAPQILVRGQGAAPIVVVGTTGDSATPYQQAVWMADQLESGVLLTYEGAGHGSFRQRCVEAHLQKYFADGTVPAKGAKCS